MRWPGPRARFRIYTTAGDYVACLRDVLLGRTDRGDAVARLEAEVCRRFGTAHAMAVAQGRVGVYLAVKALIRPGQKVVLSPYTIADVINMVICAGGVPVFADIDRPTTNVRLDTIRDLIDADTGAVMVTHLHGIACDIEGIAALCRERGIPLIEDAAQAFGARVHGRSVGTFGDVGIFSFGMYKNVTAFYGGMVVTSRADIAAAMAGELAGAAPMELGVLLAKVMKAAFTDVSTMPLLFRSVVFWIFRFGHLRNIRAITKFVTVELDTSRKTALPPSYLRRFRTMQARMVLRQLDTFGADAAVRVRYARLYTEGLAGLSGLLLPPLRGDGSAVYNYFPVQYVVREALVRWAIRHGRDIAVQHLKNCAGLESFAAEYRACPDAAATASETILLPNYPSYGADEVLRNVEVIRRFFEAGCPRV